MTFKLYNAPQSTCSQRVRFVLNAKHLPFEEVRLNLLEGDQLKPEYRYRHEWTEGDLLMWENFGTIHNAIADYGPTEHRLVKRCQVMATRFGL